MASSSKSNGTHFSDSHFEKKLSNLKDTQESIQGLSMWCLHHKSSFKQIISCWLRMVKKSKVEQCLTLFYLANDVVQHSKKKNCLDIVAAWEPALQEAAPFVRYTILFFSQSQFEWFKLILSIIAAGKKKSVFAWSGYSKSGRNEKFTAVQWLLNWTRC